MKKIQFALVMAVLVVLLAFGIYARLSENYRFRYAPNDRFQTFLLAGEEAVTEVQLFFAGEQIPLHDRRVASRLRREMQTQTYYNNSQALMLQRASYWLPQFDGILKKYGVPRDFRYLAVVESMLTNAVSPRGAAGYWQLMPETARELGLEVNDEVDERYNPVKATHAAGKYLRQAHRTFGNWTNVAASYNMGVGGIQAAMRSQDKTSFYHLRLNAETSRYLFRIAVMKQIVENPRDFGYRNSRYAVLGSQYKRFRVEESIPDLGAFAEARGTSLVALRAANAWLRGNSLTIKSLGSTYELLLPPPEAPKEPSAPRDTVVTQPDSLATAPPVP